MNERVFSVLYMFVATLIFTSLVSGVRLVNEERIRTNEKVRLEKVILDVLDIPVVRDTANDDLVKLFASRVKTKLVAGRTVYIAYDPITKIPVRYGIAISGPGFWGPISAIVATDRDFTHILEIAFHRHQETPGLGGRISEQWFADQFAGLPLADEPGRKNFFSITPPAPGKSPGEIDAITGATQTSRAVETFLNREIAFIKERQEQIKEE